MLEIRCPSDILKIISSPKNAGRYNVFKTKNDSYATQVNTTSVQVSYTKVFLIPKKQKQNFLLNFTLQIPVNDHISDLH